MTMYSNFLNFVVSFLAFVTPVLAYAVPDLTIVGFFESEGGIGKVPVTILETLGDDINVNFVCTGSRPNLGIEMSLKALACVNNQNQEAGKIAILTDLVWNRWGNSSAKIPKESLIKIAYSMLETTKIPSMWVQILNKDFDAVVVPDPYVSNLYQNSGVKIPIFVLALPMILKPYLERPLHQKNCKQPFTFGDTSANKNPVTLIEAFFKAFGNDPNVRLLMRAGDLNCALIEQMISKYNITNIVRESGKIPLKDYIDCLMSIDCYVNLSRGEGFSYIPRECLSLGIPVIITNNTASTTICNSGFVKAVPSFIKGPASPHLKDLFGEPCGNQYDCEVQDVVNALKDVYENYSEYYEKALKGREWVKQYDCSHPHLQSLYRTLIKPKHVKLGTKNEVTEDTLITNSKELHDKYLKLQKT